MACCLLAGLRFIHGLSETFFLLDSGSLSPTESERYGTRKIFECNQTNRLHKIQASAEQNVYF
jgi:hypothetical protein